MLEGSYYSLYLYLRYVRPHAGMSWSGINVVLARVYTLAGRVCNNTRQHSCILTSRIQALIILLTREMQDIVGRA